MESRNPLVARAGRPSAHALGIAAAGAAALLAAGALPLDGPPLSVLSCPLRAATGIPCLSCGATHAFHFVARLHPLEAVAANPLAALAAALLAAHCLWTLLRLGGLPYAPQAPALSPVAARALRLGIVALLAANWAFVLVRGAA